MKKIYLLLLATMIFAFGSFAQTTYYSKASATDFNDVNTWGTATNGTGASPSSISNADNYIVANSSILNLSASANVRQLTITLGSLAVTANTLTVQINAAKNSFLLINGGTLNVSGGIVNVDGFLSNTSGSFIQSGGAINIDCNNAGATATSTTATQYTLNLASTTALNWTGGTITLVDPPASTSATHHSLYYNTNTTSQISTNHTIRFGDGTSSDAGGNVIGFRIANFVASGKINYGNIIVNGPSVTNRSVTQQSFTNNINGNFTINSNGFFDQGTVGISIGGNLINNGTLTAGGTITFALASGTGTLAAVTNAQTVSGSGVFRNLTTSPTANFTSITVNNTSVAGLVFANGYTNIATQPTNSISMSGTLTPTAGKISSPSNLFVLGTSVPATGTVTYTTGSQTGGFPSGTTFGRWTTAASGGTTLTSGADPTNGTSRYPFISSAGTSRSMWIGRTTPTAAGIINILYTEASGTSLVSPVVADGAYSINTRSNDSWTTSVSNGTAAAASYTLAIVAPGAYSAPDATTRIMKLTTVVGTHQAGSATPGGQRITVALSDLSGTYYLGFNSPTCFPVTGLANTAITNTTASHSWLAPVSGTVPAGYEYAVTTSATPPAMGTSTTSLNANSTGLTANTTYYLHVRSFCGGADFSIWTTSSFYTGYCLASATNATPSWINVFNTTGGVTNITHTAATAAAGGYADLTSTSVSNYLGQTTNISLTAGGPTCGFAIWVDWNNNLIFETTERVFATSGFTTTITGTIAIPAAQANGNYRMRVLTDYNISAPSNPCGLIARGEYKDFTFTVVAAPSCLAPTALVNSAVTSTSASHSWTAASPVPAVGYEWAVTTSATPPASGTATTGLTASSTGLTPNTTYYLHVRSDCGAGLFSSWATSSFYTGYCLASSTNATPSWISAFSTTAGVSNITHSASTAAAGGYADVTTSVVSNYLGQTTNISLTAGGPTCGFAIWVDWNNNLIFETTEREFVTSGYVTTITGTIAIPAAQANGNYRMRIVTDYNNTAPTNPCGLISRGEYKDFTFRVVDAPSCIAPTALVNSAVTSTSASHSWTAASPAPAVGYEWAVTTSATPPASGTATTGLTASSTGLTPNTTYYLHVRSDCGAGLFSNWVTSASFYTGYCLVGGPVSSTAFINSFSTTGGTTNITNLASGYSTGGYGDFTSQKVIQIQGGLINFSGSPTSPDSDGKAIWVDYNDNLVFEATEKVFNTAAYTTTITGSFTVPTTAPVGNHRMRIVMDNNATSPVACGTISLGEAEDYTLEVISAPACAGPINGGTATSSIGTVCGSGTTVLNSTGGSTGTGLTYQWQSSPAGMNTFTDISGATTLSYTTSTITTSTDFQLVVTCSNGPVSGTSTVVSVIIGSTPTNDNCTGAILLTHNTDPQLCATTAGTTACATTSTEGSSSYFSSQDDDVWYSFTATSSIVVINLSNITLASGTYPSAMGIGLHTACGTADVVNNGTGGIITAGNQSFTVFGLTVGTEYKVRILTVGTTSRVNFNICLTVPSITSGTNNTCTTGSPVTISTANSNTTSWIPLFNTDGNLIAEINANGNELGLVTPSVYTTNNPVLRSALIGGAYMNRNVAITVATQPTTPVSVRLYYTKAEKDALDVASPGVNNGSDIVITKEPGGCTPTSSLAGGSTLSQTYSTYGATNAYSQLSVSSFSEFFLHKGTAGALPISVEYLNGTKQASSNLLDWKINCTSVSSVFIELQRSADARKFNTLNAQTATDVRCQQAFDYKDANPLAGTNYYRLKVTEPNGTVKYSNIIALINKDKGFEIVSLAPNPARANATLSLATAKAGRVDILITDVVGKVIAKQSNTLVSGNNTINMNFAQYAAGTYNIAVTNADGEVKTTRFVKY